MRAADAAPGALVVLPWTDCPRAWRNGRRQSPRQAMIEGGLCRRGVILGIGRYRFSKTTLCKSSVVVEHDHASLNAVVLAQVPIKVQWDTKLTKAERVEVTSATEWELELIPLANVMPLSMWEEINIERNLIAMDMAALAHDRSVLVSQLRQLLTDHVLTQNLTDRVSFYDFRIDDTGQAELVLKVRSIVTADDLAHNPEMLEKYNKLRADIAAVNDKMSCRSVA